MQRKLSIASDALAMTIVEFLVEFYFTVLFYMNILCRPLISNPTNPEPTPKPYVVILHYSVRTL